MNEVTVEEEKTVEIDGRKYTRKEIDELVMHKSIMVHSFRGHDAKTTEYGDRGCVKLEVDYLTEDWMYEGDFVTWVNAFTALYYGDVEAWLDDDEQEKNVGKAMPLHLLK